MQAMTKNLKFVLYILQAMFLPTTKAAVNVAADGFAQELVTALRKDIFIDVAHLEERQRSDVCSSLAGPQCFKSAMSRHATSTAEESSKTNTTKIPVELLLSGVFMAEALAAQPAGGDITWPGVIPERLLDSQGSEAPYEFITPEYFSLTSLINQFGLQGRYLRAAGAFPFARKAFQRGVLRIQGLSPDMPLPTTFSASLPEAIKLTWDGSWEVRDCPAPLSAAIAGVESTPLKLPQVLNNEANVSMMLEGPRPVSTHDTLVAELTGNRGYVRFSTLVVIHSLQVWWPTLPDMPMALVGGRLGLDTVWATHLDPARLQPGSSWLEIQGNQQAIDELVFLGTPGLGIGAIHLAAASLHTVPITLMSPFRRSSYGDAGEQSAESSQIQFLLTTDQVSLGAASKFLSLHEVIERDLRIRLNGSTKHIPGRLTLPLSQQAVLPMEEVAALGDAMTNHQLFEHASIMNLMAQVHSSVARKHRWFASSGGVLTIDHAQSLTDILVDPSMSALAPDIRTSLLREQRDVVEAIIEFVFTGGSWQRSKKTRTYFTNKTRSKRPAFEDAKQWQKRLDLLTVACLHLWHHHDRNSA